MKSLARMTRRIFTTGFSWILPLSIGIFLMVRAGNVTVASLSLSESWSFFCVLFVASWWVVYTVSSWFEVSLLSHLRTFLRKKSALRVTQAEARKAGTKPADIRDAFTNKSRSLVTVVSLLIVMMIFGINLIVPVKNATPYQKLLVPFIFAFAAIAFALFLMSIDMFDTVANLFLDASEDLRLKRLFYIAGLKRAYLAMAVFSVFLTLSLSFIYAPAAGFYASTLTICGYAYWFGNIHDGGQETDFSYRRSDAVVGIVIGTLLLLITISISVQQSVR